MNLKDDLKRISLAEKKNKLLSHLKFIDLNKDNLIDKDEISQYILNYFKRQDADDARVKKEDLDTNKDGFVEWDEYLSKVYGYTLQELESFKSDKSQEMANFMKLVEDDEGRFKVADEDKDNKLNETEYGAFLYPANYAHMHEYEVNLVMRNIDKDGDGYVTFDEYLGHSTPDEVQRVVDYENFLFYDENSDKKLNRHEIRHWLMPEKKTIAGDEAEHLIQETDRNEDGVLTFDEVMDSMERWLGSAVTEYGEGLKSPHDEL
ncbi:hypothetical protein HELRODRAFT_64364 [Helobdella robusta]|uniref:EF-hand domain-containing protein n=1 Tax=Helobdella robusta TaxID=6412 RepID=T1FXT5_HELRO|nr:hypothetical protein HELRODRAFT_64364 [Helobdella robusta]ESO06721.1 hypothetical protein HELRODRAFT_64364 [Helobdella robusta]